jgi:dimethylglycine dehydrogenase
MLTPKGKIECEGTIVRFGADRFYVVTAAVAELHDRDWLEAHCPPVGVRIEDVTLRDGVLVLAGPKARDVLSKLTRADLSNRAFPWLTAREIEIANVPVRALRCNYVGELGWELHHPFVHQTRLYDALIEAGRDHGLAHFGTRAMNSMRLEKAYRAWGTDLTLEVDPIEAGLDRLVKLDGRDFIGRKALEEAKRAGHKWRLAILSVDAAESDAPTNAPVFANGSYAGIVASGGYGHTVKTSIALAYLTPPHDWPGSRVEVEILGKRCSAIVAEKPLYDPENARLKA